MQIRIFGPFAHLFLLLWYIVELLPFIFWGVRYNWYQSYNSTIIEIGAQKSQSGPIARPNLWRPILLHRPHWTLKSDNLKYITMARWLGRTNDSSTKHLMFQVLFFFLNFLQNSLKKSFQFIFLFSYNFIKMKIMGFECLKSIRNYEKKCMEHQTLGRWVVRPSKAPRDPGTEPP